MRGDVKKKNIYECETGRKNKSRGGGGGGERLGGLEEEASAVWGTKRRGWTGERTGS